MKYHGIIKALAIILCVVSLVVMAVSAVGLTVAVYLDLYRQDADAYLEANRAYDAKRYATELVQKHAARTFGGCSEEILRHYYGSWDHLWDEDKLQYAILDRKGNILEGSRSTEENDAKYIFMVSPRYLKVVDALVEMPGNEMLPTGATIPTMPTGATEPVYEHTFSIGWQDEETGIYQDYVLTYMDGPEYLVELYLQKDAYQAASDIEWQAVSLLWQLRYTMIGIFIAALVVFVTALIYLCFAAGHKPGRTAVIPGGLNRIPLDIYGAAAVILVILGVYAIAFCAYGVKYEQYRVLSISGMVAAAVVMALVLVGFVFAFAAQRKLGRRALLKRTLVGRVLVWCWHKGKRVWAVVWKGMLQLMEVLPLAWQWLLTGLVFGLLLLISISARDELLLLVTVISYIAVCAYGSYAFGQLLKQAKEMNSGDLSVRKENPLLVGCFKNFGLQLNSLSDVVSTAAREQMKSERMKAELITNVSHDLKTPLTSIINYVDLLQKAETPEATREYLQVLSRQSQHMKKLIEDLMEMSKASTGNLAVELTKVDAVETLNQALGEFADRLNTARLTTVLRLPESPLFICADGKLTWRVLNNLLGNVVKYALADTRVYIDLQQQGNKAVLSLKNISRESLNISSEELMERFVRGDASRNTEGSGLGLNIAKSLMDLQHGQLTLVVDGDLFKVCLEFPVAMQ